MHKLLLINLFHDRVRNVHSKFPESIWRKFYSFRGWNHWTERVHHEAPPATYKMADLRNETKRKWRADAPAFELNKSLWSDDVADEWWFNGVGGGRMMKDKITTIILYFNVMFNVHNAWPDDHWEDYTLNLNTIFFLLSMKRVFRNRTLICTNHHQPCNNVWWDSFIMGVEYMTQ